jgi:RNA ligase (TIGR02306 family)
MNLATVQTISNIESIEGADLIEKATVLGWEVVVKKGEYKIGDNCVYIQIDTCMPPLPEYEFLKERKYRVKTIKLKKQISQGLILPLPEGAWRVGDDLTDLLGVTKYAKDIEERQPNWLRRIWNYLTHKPSSNFPKHLVPITDEERIQNIPEILEDRKGDIYIVSEKLDGSSITIIMDKKKFRICSRKFELYNDNEWSQVFKSTQFKKYMLKLAEYYQTNNIIVQGEFIGKPQGNKYKLEQNEIRLFNIYVNGERLLQDHFYMVCKLFQIPCCPLIATVPLDFTLPEIIAYAEGKSKLYNIDREGVVFRCIKTGFSFKVISNKFLIKNNE